MCSAVVLSLCWQGFNFMETSDDGIVQMGIWTMFSAANYQDHGNKGAVLIFSDPAEPPEPLIFESAEEAASIKEVTWMQHTG